MKRWRRRSDWSGPRLLRWGLAVLSGLSLVLLVNVLHLFGLLSESRRAMDDSVREDAMWAVYQTDRQVSRLIAAIDGALWDGVGPGLGAVIEAYDILYSRAQLLENGSFSVKFEGTEALSTPAARVREGILGLASAVDALAVVRSVPALRALRDHVVLVQADTSELVLQTNAALNQASVAQRAEVKDLQQRLGLNVALLVVGFAGIVALLALQMRLIAAVGRKLAVLGERNRAVAKRARAASRAKSTFLATMSHEIRTPLNGIIGTAELMAHSALSDDQARHLSMIRQSGYHLLEVISDVLDFSKLESGRVEFERHRVRLSEIADSLVAMLEPRAEMKGLRLQVDLPALELGTDPARLRQVLVNLVGNAIKFTSDGSVTVRGRLIGPDRLRVEITDTGIGIAPEGLPLLFRDFSQVDGSASRSFGGSGLGLAICKRIVEGLQGRIGVESRSGQGSTFWIELPVDAPHPCGKAAPTHPDSAPTTERAFKGRVLVVEDNPVNQAVAKGLLDWLGVEVTMAHNGAEAVDLLERQSFDLVFMDVQMPVMSGIEATQAIRRRGDRVRIVGLTGNAFTSDRQACLRAGMDDFVPKPVTQDKLAQVLIEAGLRSRSAGGSEGRGVSAPPCSAPEGPTPRFERPVVDEGLVVHLVRTLGAETVAALLDEVLAEAEGLPDALDVACRTGEEARADALLHSFKGAAATLGLAEAARRAQALRGDPCPVAADMALLQEAARQGVEEIRRLCSRNVAPQAA